MGGDLQKLREGVAPSMLTPHGHFVRERPHHNRAAHAAECRCSGVGRQCGVRCHMVRGGQPCSDSAEWDRERLCMALSLGHPMATSSATEAHYPPPATVPLCAMVVTSRLRRHSPQPRQSADRYRSPIPALVGRHHCSQSTTSRVSSHSTAAQRRRAGVEGFGG
jgi:hypothetical protein